MIILENAFEMREKIVEFINSMKNILISKSKRLRSTPFTSRIENQGVKSYTVYNHMLLPTTFSSVEKNIYI